MEKEMKQALVELEKGLTLENIIALHNTGLIFVIADGHIEKMEFAY